MLSRIFQYVANRNNFVSPWLRTQARFDPVEADPKINKIRELLKLDLENLDSDYFVTSAVAVFMSNHTVAHSLDLEIDIQPEIWKKIQTERFKILSGDWLLVNSKDGPVFNRRVVTDWPVELEGIITKLDDTSARIQIGQKISNVKAVLVNNSVLQIEWPEWLNINGVLTTNNPEAWDAAGKTIRFFAPPKNYPIAAVIDSLKYNPNFLDVLEQKGFLAYYSGADINPAEQLSIIIYCLYLDTASKIKERI